MPDVFDSREQVRQFLRPPFPTTYLHSGRLQSYFPILQVLVQSRYLFCLRLQLLLNRRGFGLPFLKLQLEFLYELLLQPQCMLDLLRFDLPILKLQLQCCYFLHMLLKLMLNLLHLALSLLQNSSSSVIWTTCV